MKNIERSIFQKLLQKSKKERENFNLVLTRFALERFLFRLSVSRYKEKFILKGASLFVVWLGHNYRGTRDIDFLGFGSPDKNIIQGIISEICNLTAENDGLTFDTKSMRTDEIREGQAYQGIRVNFKASLYTAQISLQIDIGFGDAITPSPEQIIYPSILDFNPPKLLAYSRYTFVAEKVEAMVHLEMANSRMKDFYDIQLVSKTFYFEGTLLLASFQNTFSRRNTKLITNPPIALTKEFYNSIEKQKQWNAFLKRVAETDNTLTNLEDTIKYIFNFLNLPLTCMYEHKSLLKNWEPKGGWVY